MERHINKKSAPDVSWRPHSSFYMNEPLKLPDPTTAKSTRVRNCRRITPSMPNSCSTLSVKIEATRVRSDKVNMAESNVELIRSLYVMHRQELCTYLSRQFRLDRTEAEDIVQGAFTRLAELPNLGDIENHRAFLYKMCGNMVLDARRHAQVSHNYAASMTPEDEAFTEVGPAEETEVRQRLGLIASALWGMPSKRRELLMMNRFDGLSYAEIARRVGLSETVVRKHVSKALADCHKALNTDHE